jgi:hypothetical protein
MIRITLLTLIVVFVVSTACLGGNNPATKVAVHVLPHAERSCTKSFPAISGCEQIVATYEGGGDIDVFVVFYDLAAHRGLQYSLSWPSAWGTCAFTSCSDLTIGEITNPGDGVAHAYTSCDSSFSRIAGYGWIDAGESGGYIEIIDAPSGLSTQVADCLEGLDAPVMKCRAGVNGLEGDDPCGERGDGSEGDGESGALRGYYRP